MLDNDLPTMDRHWWRIEFAFRTFGLSPFLDPRALHVSTSYPIAVSTAAPQSRLRRLGLRRTRPFSMTAFEAKPRCGRPPGSGEADQACAELVCA